MKWILGTLCLFAMYWASTASAVGVPVVYVNNVSTVVSKAELDAAIPDFQTAVSRDLVRYWGTDAVITDDPGMKPQASMVVNIIDDTPMIGALGYHDHKGMFAYAEVAAATSEADGTDWRVVFTHELFEMLVDPYLNHFSKWDKKFWLVEVADPVEASSNNYKINDTPISDFITPRWYDRNLHGRFDMAGKLHSAGEVVSEGYAVYWDGTWQYVEVF